MSEIFECTTGGWLVLGLTNCAILSVSLCITGYIVQHYKSMLKIVMLQKEIDTTKKSTIYTGIPPNPNNYDEVPSNTFRPISRNILNSSSEGIKLKNSVNSNYGILHT
jgi:hypothetical protein